MYYVAWSLISLVGLGHHKGMKGEFSDIPLPTCTRKEGAKANWRVEERWRFIFILFYFLNGGTETSTAKVCVCVCGVIINEEADPILFHNNKKTNIGNWHPSAFFLSLHILLSLSKQNNARNSLR